MAEVLTNGTFLFTCFVAVIVAGLTITSVVRNKMSARKWDSYYKACIEQSKKPKSPNYSKDSEGDE